MPTRNVNLSDHFDQFISERIAAGRFSNASEIVREGLRLLEQREQEDQAKIEWLRGAAKEGFDAFENGDYSIMVSAREVDNLLGEIHKEVAAELRQTSGS